ncbi:unnamed protein product [Heligmosomoides polygyrus]|uniref:Secreted protein n=1 Tax=Heligmosomoides polygyrus TaxID=6339 RepID=A0A183FUM0_HELPZ|nr:unnamed protein product [Heligmosomoides polygyrus]
MLSLSSVVHASLIYIIGFIHPLTACSTLPFSDRDDEVRLLHVQPKVVVSEGSLPQLDLPFKLIAAAGFWGDILCVEDGPQRAQDDQSLYSEASTRRGTE